MLVRYTRQEIVTCCLEEAYDLNLYSAVRR